MKIVRLHLNLTYRQSFYAIRLYMDHCVLVLQFALDKQKFPPTLFTSRWKHSRIGNLRNAKRDPMERL
jgi:hypothetical protein